MPERLGIRDIVCACEQKGRVYTYLKERLDCLENSLLLTGLHAKEQEDHAPYYQGVVARCLYCSHLCTEAENGSAQHNHATCSYYSIYQSVPPPGDTQGMAKGRAGNI
jgi:hypothetical protein